MSALWDAVASAVWPVDCLKCGEPVAGLEFCPACAMDVEPRAGPTCVVCDVDVIDSGADGRCGPCAARAPPFERAWSVFDYAGPVGDAIRAAKYAGRPDAMVVVERNLCALLPEALRSSPPEAVVPMALHWRRVDLRGFSAPLQLAAAVARALGVRWRTRWLRRLRDTPSQAGLSDVARRKNVRGAFRGSTKVQGRDVLLVDDVLTTGASAEAAAKALQRAGAARVRVLVAAYVSPDR